MKFKKTISEVLWKHNIVPKSKNPRASLSGQSASYTCKWASLIKLEYENWNIKIQNPRVEDSIQWLDILSNVLEFVKECKQAHMQMEKEKYILPQWSIYAASQ